MKSRARPPAVEALRRHVMCALAEEGPLTLEEIPRAWPILRMHLRGVAGELVAEGLVERLPGGTRRQHLALTPLGERAVLAPAGGILTSLHLPARSRP